MDLFRKLESLLRPGTISGEDDADWAGPTSDKLNSNETAVDDEGDASEGGPVNQDNDTAWADRNTEADAADADADADADEDAPPLADAPPRRESGVQIARSQERLALEALHRFGWLLTQDFARLLWPDYCSSLGMAYRLVRRLAGKKEILVRRTKYGSMLVLARRGVCRLRDELNILARTGKDLDPGNFWHRRLANAYVIENYLSRPYGWPTFYTEFEIQSRRAPFFSVSNKVPDAIFVRNNTCAWIEVEHARKRQNDFSKLVNFAACHLSKPMRMNDDLTLTSLVFVYEDPSHPVRIRNALLRLRQAEQTLDWERIGEAILFAQIAFGERGLCTDVSVRLGL